MDSVWTTKVFYTKTYSKTLKEISFKVYNKESTGSIRGIHKQSWP